MGTEMFTGLGGLMPGAGAGNPFGHMGPPIPQGVGAGNPQFGHMGPPLPPIPSPGAVMPRPPISQMLGPNPGFGGGPTMGGAPPMMGGNALSGRMGGMQMAAGGMAPPPGGMAMPGQPGGQDPFHDASGGGFINSDVPGRTDELPLSVPPGSHVIPADTVSGAGQGNSIAGAKKIWELLEMMAEHGGGAQPPPQPPPQQFPPGEQPPPGMAGGGEPPTDIMAAGGEIVVPPEMVRAIGAGDERAGHDMLDQFILNTRKQTAEELMQLPGPKK